MSSKLIQNAHSFEGNIGTMSFGMRNTKFGPRKVMNLRVAENVNNTTNWYNMAFWGHDAQVLNDSFKVGDHVKVEGDLYEDIDVVNGSQYVHAVVRNPFVTKLESSKSRVRV